ncbi:putative methyltransferase PMT2 [Hordeum vulgare]|nr:putative methyltransferase PMT2 [Hordeum vulgare]
MWGGKDGQEPTKDAPPLDVGEEDTPPMEEDVDLWPEQRVILNSIRSKSAAEATHLRRQQMEVARATEAATQAAQASTQAAQEISDNDEK